jgi:hypothetical protein
MCEQDNCIQIREFKQITGGIDTSCIYGAPVSPRSYDSPPQAPSYISTQISY